MKHTSDAGVQHMLIMAEAQVQLQPEVALAGLCNITESTGCYHVVVRVTAEFHPQKRYLIT